MPTACNTAGANFRGSENPSPINGGIRRSGLMTCESA